MKKGPLSNAEKAYIKQNAAFLSPQAMSVVLDKPVRAVLTFMNTAGQAPIDESPVRSEIRHELLESMAWRNLKDEFDEDELRFFQERYVALKEQFRDDVMASEEGQLFKVIKSEILMHRNLVQQKRAQVEIDRLEELRTSFLAIHLGGDGVLAEVDQATLLNTDTLLETAYASKQSRTNEYEKLDRGHSEIMKSLKATREQRIAKIEGTKRTVGDILRMLAEQEARDRADRQIDQMRKATTKELKRLGAVHTFADNVLDRPILSADTVEMEE